MRILLLGEYSNVHATLAEGLRALGHCVVVASDGDGWKDYPRDIDLRRDMGDGAGWCRRMWKNVRYQLRLLRLFATRFRGFDVVQVINPVFLPLRAERIWPYYRWLSLTNRSVFMAAYGMDHYWVRAGLDCRTFRYSDFNFGDTIRTDVAENELFVRDWLNGPKGVLNRRMAADCDGIPAGLYEYWASYNAHLAPDLRHKLRYIPFPIRVEPLEGEENEDTENSSTKAEGGAGAMAECTVEEQRNCLSSTLSIDNTEPTDRPVRFFIGVQRSRSAYKGTDVMLRALRRVEERYPGKVVVRVVENVPYAEYIRLMHDSDVILDQLYSYTPAMNALQAMSQGLVAVSGAEPEYYELQGCGTDERPIFNVEPTEDHVFQTLCHIVEHRDRLPLLKRQSRDFVIRHHDHVAVARQYVEFWTQCSKS